MQVAFLVNDRSEPSVDQTTTGLVGAALRRGHNVVVFGVGDLSFATDGKLRANGCRLEGAQAKESVVQRLRNHFAEPIELDPYDLWLMRTNPARDADRAALHIAALRMAEHAEEHGVCVVNRPRALARAMTKLSLLDLPQHLQPKTLVSHDAEEIERFLRDLPRTGVIKPLQGTRGQDVFVLGAPSKDNNARQVIDVILRQGYAVVQEFVEGAEGGDVRVVVLNGKILELDGQAAAVARVPHQEDFRSNIHAGGKSTPATITPAMRDAVTEIAPYLEREGITHTGVDFVGGTILEINVFSPGGLVPAEKLYGVDFLGKTIETFERLVATT